MALGGVISTIWNENVGLDRCAYLFSGASWQINKRLGREFAKTLPNGAKLKVYPSSAYSEVFYCRWPERKDLLFIRANASLGKTFVDVGANVGKISACLFAVFDRFVMFERLGRTNLDNILKFHWPLGYVLFFVKDDGGISQDEALIQKPLINLFGCPANVFLDLRSY